MISSSSKIIQTPMEARPFGALYIHIPFCKQRCAYCDFQTHARALDDPRIDEHVNKLIQSLNTAAAAGLLDEVRTIYIGGGTPSYIGERRLETLLKAVARNVNMAQVSEFTLEANPDSFTPEVAQAAQQLGITRVSLGVQSLDDGVLEILGRVHNAQQARDAVMLGLAHELRVSADVMCGVPGQARPSLSSTIEQLLQLGVEHVSVYPLSVEEDTGIDRMIEASLMDDIDEDEQAAQMELAEQLLQGAGMMRYEVASYAKPGCYSQHNCAYWTAVPYLGLGMGASSMLDAHDVQMLSESGVFAPWGWEGFDSNAAEVASRSGGRLRVSLGYDGVDAQVLTDEQAAAEDAMLSMRMNQGISRERLNTLAQLNPRLHDAAQSAIERELAQWQNVDGNSWLVPTYRGWLMGNELYILFWECAL